MGEFVRVRLACLQYSPSLLKTASAQCPAIISCMLPPAYHPERPNREAVETLHIFVDRVAAGEEDARAVAQVAVALGFMLIGGTVSKKVHYPVAEGQHQYANLLHVEKGFQPIPEAVGRKTLQAGFQSEIAIITGIFGDLNDRKQRYARARSLGLEPGTPESRFGWGVDFHKSRSIGFVKGEDACVTTHASPQMIVAASNPDNPLGGVIDVIFPHPSGVRIAHDLGQYLFTIPRRTVATIPLLSTIDLPRDIVPTRYTPRKAAA